MTPLKINLIYFLYVITLTAIIVVAFYIVSPKFYSYIIGIVVGLSIGFLTESKFKNYISKIKLTFRPIYHCIYAWRFYSVNNRNCSTYTYKQKNINNINIILNKSIHNKSLLLNVLSTNLKIVLSIIAGAFILGLPTAINLLYNGVMLGLLVLDISRLTQERNASR